MVLSAYKNGQERDHRDYESGFDAKPLTNDIPLMNRSNAWADRPSDDHLLDEGARPYTDHHRDMSGHSVSTIIGEPLQEEAGGYGVNPQPYSTQQPLNAYTQDPGPTTQFSNNYYLGDAGAAATSSHPGKPDFDRQEGSRCHRWKLIDKMVANELAS